MNHVHFLVLTIVLVGSFIVIDPEIALCCLSHSQVDERNDTI